MTMLCLIIIRDIAIIVKGLDFRCIIHGITKSEAIHLLKNLCLMIVCIYKIHVNEIKSLQLNAKVKK